MSAGALCDPICIGQCGALFYETYMYIRLEVPQLEPSADPELVFDVSPSSSRVVLCPKVAGSRYPRASLVFPMMHSCTLFLLLFVLSDVPCNAYNLLIQSLQ